MSERIKTVINNGAIMPNECDCIWCGATMRRGGATYTGAGVNQCSLWCDNCGAVVIHAREFGRKIEGFSIKFELEGENK